MSPSAGRELTLLRRLARLYDIQTSYSDMEQQRLDATPEALWAALRTLAAPVDQGDELAALIEARRWELWNWRLEPVLVAWEGELKYFALRLPEREAKGTVAFRIRLESGETSEWQVRLESLQVRRRTQTRGTGYLELQIEAGQTLPWGYHHLTLEIADKQLDTLVIAAPYRSYNPPAGRRWGVLLPVYALHSCRSWGVGDFADLAGLVDWATEQGAGFVGTLPLLASFLDEKPFDPSPYSPVSRLFWNELFVAAEGVDVPDEAKELSKEPLVQYREAMALKRQALWPEAKAFFAGNVTEKRAYQAFRASQSAR